MKKISLILIKLFFVFSLITISCSHSADSSNGKNADDDVNPVPYSSRFEMLDYIYDTTSLTEITINITRTEWNHLLKYFDWESKNEECVHADFVMTKNGFTWKKSDVGLAIRGKTSRCRPQKGWGKAESEPVYEQSHFKINLEEFLTGDQEYKLADCLKTITLKRAKDDPTYAREVFCYNFFRKNGIWTSPRACHAHLTINISDEEDTESVDFGIYEMIEKIDKQFLKARDGKNKKQLTSADGNLWKCTWEKDSGPDFNNSDESNFGVEKVSFKNVVFDDQNIGTEEDTSSYEKFTRKTFNYDLKTNKKQLDSAKVQIQEFINGLTALPSDYSEENAAQIKAWYENNIYPDLLLKTYAINVLLGMWDDYWNSNNNFYFYLDTDGKGYLIPYDYDNTLGVNDNGIDWARRNPIEWPRDYGTHPLIEKALLVPEYMALYKKYLKEICESDFFDSEKAAAQIKAYHSVISGKVNSPDLCYTSATFNEISDTTMASWGSPYRSYKIFTPNDELNYFEVRKKYVTAFLNGEEVEIDVEKDKLPVIYDETKTDEEVKIIFRPSDFKYYSMWLMNQGVSKDKSADCIEKISVRGYMPKCWYSDEENGIIGGWNAEHLWLEDNEIEMEYDSETGFWYKTFPKAIFDEENGTPYYFKFVLTWKDEVNDFTWLDYDKLSTSLPEEILYEDIPERPEDKKYNLNAICDLFK